MKRLFCFIVAFLLAINCVRAITGNSQLTFVGFLESLSRLDLDFSTVISAWDEIAVTFGSINWSTNFLDILKNVLSIIQGILLVLRLPVAMIVDLIEFVYSCLSFAFFLLGLPLST